MTDPRSHDADAQEIGGAGSGVAGDAVRRARDISAGNARWRRARPAATALLGPLIVIALSAVRSPSMMAHGRLWAEETLFLAHALSTRSLPQQVFHVYRGHLELLTSTVFAIASRLGLGTIPLWTTHGGLLIECSLAFLVVFFRKDLEIRLRSALLICALVVVSPCAVEHDLNLLNSVWLVSAIVLLLIHLPPTRLAKHEWLVVPATFVFGLSGIPATSLMPLALLHGVVWRSRPHLLMAASLTLCGLIHGALVLTHGAEGRFSSVSGWVYLAGPFLHIVVEHLLGLGAASVLGGLFKDAAINGASLPSVMLAPLALLAWMTGHIVRKGETRSRLLLVAMIYTCAFNITFALGDRNDLFTVYAMRYFFLPGFALALLIARSDRTASRWPRGFPFGVLLFVTLFSARDFFRDGFYETYVVSRHEWRRDVDRCEALGTACVIDVDPGLTIELPARTGNEAVVR